MGLDSSLSHIMRVGSCGAGGKFPSSGSVFMDGISNQVYFTAPGKMCQCGRSTSYVRPFRRVGLLLGKIGRCSHLIRCGGRLVDLDRRRVYVTDLEGCGGKTRAYVIPVRLPSIRLMRNTRMVIPISSSLVVVPSCSNFTLFGVPSRGRRGSRDSLVRVHGICLSCPGSSLVCASGFLSIGDAPRVTCGRGTVQFRCKVSSLARKRRLDCRCELGSHG